MGRRGFGLLPHTPALIQSGHLQRSLGACVRGGRSWAAGASPPSREAVPRRGFLTLGLWAGQVFFMASVFGFLIPAVKWGLDTQLIPL